MTPDGTVSTFAGSGLNGSNDGPVTTARFSKPIAVGVTSDGTVYVSDAGINRLRKISGGVVTTPGIIGSFVDIAVDTADTLYLLQGGLVAKITAAGVASTLGGLPGLQFAEDESTTMRFRGLAVDNAGNVFVTDVGLCLVRKITPEGIVTTLAGAPITSTERCGYIDGVGRTAKFGEDLAGIAVDAAGNLYVADGDNLAIRKITATGLVTTLAR